MTDDEDLESEAREASIARADEFLRRMKAVPEDQRTPPQQPDKFSGPPPVVREREDDEKSS